MIQKMKHCVSVLLDKAGYELRYKSKHVKQSRNTMGQALQWVRNNGFEVATVLDVGASDGRWSKECMEYFSDARYVLFEPQPVHSVALDTFARSCKQTVTPVKKAVGSSNGRIQFDISDPFGGGLSTGQSNNTAEVDLTTLDSCLSKLQPDDPFLLKLDTHGFEKGILEGAEKILKKCEVLVIEAYNYRITDEALLFWELCAFLATKGFRPIDLVDLMHRQHDNSLWQMDLFFIKSSWKGFSRITYV